MEDTIKNMIELKIRNFFIVLGVLLSKKKVAPHFYSPSMKRDWTVTLGSARFGKSGNETAFGGGSGADDCA